MVILLLHLADADHRLGCLVREDAWYELYGDFPAMGPLLYGNAWKRARETMRLAVFDFLPLCSRTQDDVYHQGLVG